MSKIIFFLSALSLFFMNSFGENIILKSGKSIEGNIIRKTSDGIMVEVGGVSIKYYFDEIQSIDGKKVGNAKGFPSGGEKNTSSQAEAQSKILPWQQWYGQVKGYLDKFEKINKKSQGLAQEENEKLKKAKNDTKLQKEIFIESTKKLDALFSEFNSLTPPTELKNFHNKLVESYTYVKVINEAALKNDKDSAYAYSQAINNLTLEAFSDLKNLYLKYGAPQEKIDSVNRVIARYLEANSREQ